MKTNEESETPQRWRPQERLEALALGLKAVLFLAALAALLIVILLASRHSRPPGVGSAVRHETSKGEGDTP